MDIEAISGKVKEFSAEQKKMQDQIAEEFKRFLADEIKTIFDGNLQTLRWTQYTPYFNDGDPCEFRVCELNAVSKVDGEVEDYYDHTAPWESKKGEWYGLKTDDGETRFTIDEAKAINSFDDLIQSNELEPIMKQMFGDHCEVIITVDGVTTEEYDHD